MERHTHAPLNVHLFRQVDSRGGSLAFAVDSYEDARQACMGNWLSQDTRSFVIDMKSGMVDQDLSLIDSWYLGRAQLAGLADPLPFTGTDLEADLQTDPDTYKRYVAALESVGVAVESMSPAGAIWAQTDPIEQPRSATDPAFQMRWVAPGEQPPEGWVHPEWPEDFWSFLLLHRQDDPEALEQHRARLEQATALMFQGLGMVDS